MTALCPTCGADHGGAACAKWGRRLRAIYEMGRDVGFHEGREFNRTGTEPEMGRLRAEIERQKAGRAVERTALQNAIPKLVEMQERLDQAEATWANFASRIGYGGNVTERAYEQDDTEEDA